MRGRDGLRGAVQDRVHRQDGGGPRQEVRLLLIKLFRENEYNVLCILIIIDNFDLSV